MAEEVATVNRRDSKPFTFIFGGRRATALFVEQTNISLIEARLKESFSDGAFSAYPKFKLVRWAGESVDVYANRIQECQG